MQLPFISVILPVRNEERYIAACVDSIFSQDYPAEKMEVIFVDGRSEDRTVEMLHAMQKNHPQILVLDNPNRTVPYAMNIGIAHSSAPVIVRLDAHAEYPADYIRLSVETLLTQDCDNARLHGRGHRGDAQNAAGRGQRDLPPDDRGRLCGYRALRLFQAGIV